MPHTILYVEDEPAIIELIQDVLQHPDIRLLSATNTAEGLAKVRALKPDLVMLDVMMPDGDGWDLYHTIRQDAALGQVPIIMLTGILHKYRIMKEFAQSPIDAYITKPFDARAVRTEVERMLGEPFWALTGPPRRESAVRPSMPAGQAEPRPDEMPESQRGSHQAV